MQRIGNVITGFGLFEYQFKWQELLWAGLTGAGAFIVTTTTAPVNAADWQSWGVALGAAVARPIFALIFGKRPPGG